jgi:hypothetical protein
MRNIKNWLGMANFFKNQKDIPELTNYLSNNKSFEKFSIGIHNIKLKVIHHIDKAAFPEHYKDIKPVEESMESKKRK